MAKRLLSIILFVLAASLPAASQNDTLSSDLGKSFKNFSVGRFDLRDSVQSGAENSTISINTADKTFELSLTPRDLRSARYEAKETSADGTRNVEKLPVTTYKGVVAGEADSAVRVTINAEGIEGFFETAAGRFFVEPAARYSSLAAPGEYVVYQAQDVLRDTTFLCPQDLAGKLEEGREFAATGSVQNFGGLKVIELATEADFDFVGTTGGSAAAANEKILSILNMVEGTFVSELNLTISVVFQHTWTTPDPFNGTNSDTLLRSFQAHWNTNFPLSQYPRDAAHLFTYKPNVRAQGFAFVGEVCDPVNAYGLSGRVDPSWGWEIANSMITAHEIGHNLGAQHAEDIPNCPSTTLMTRSLSQSVQFTFCQESRNQMRNYVNSPSGTCMTERTTGSWLDFDGDGKTDVGVFRPSTGTWWINRSSNASTFSAQFGLGTDQAAPGDFTGDGRADIALFRPSDGFWYVLRSENNSFFSFPFGTNGDISAPNDYDGDNKTDAAVFRPSTGTWYILNSGGGTGIGQFGQSGDQPVPSDYDGDNRADVAIWRASNGTWWIQKTTGGTAVYQFGLSGDRTVQGDYTGDGKTDVAVWRPSNGFWYILRSENNSFYSVPFGTSGDSPAPGDYDGDGRFDTAVFRPSTANWFIQRSTAGTAIYTFGIAGDQPVPNAFVR